MKDKQFDIKIANHNKFPVRSIHNVENILVRVCVAFHCI